MLRFPVVRHSDMVTHADWRVGKMFILINVDFLHYYLYMSTVQSHNHKKILFTF